MKKVINLGGLGVDGRQNELIETALTYGFDAVEVDMKDLLGRNKLMGRNFALQFLKSAGIKVGTFRLPIEFGASEANYQAQLADIETIADLAQNLECSECYAVIESGNDEVAFQENFERHQRRIAEAAEKLAEKGIRLGLALTPNSQRPARAMKFVEKAAELITLARIHGKAPVGICVNTLTWVQNGGTIDDVAKLSAEQITEVRLADLRDNVPVLPGEAEDSFSVALARLLHQKNYDGILSVVGSAAIFSADSRDAVMTMLSQRLGELAEIAQGMRENLPTNDTVEAEAENPVATN